jgi:hypothetical protein
MAGNCRSDTSARRSIDSRPVLHEQKQFSVPVSDRERLKTGIRRSALKKWLSGTKQEDDA